MPAPVNVLLSRVRSELSAAFSAERGPIRLSRAPGRLDVMGGIADYTGSLVLPTPLDCAASVALQARDDRLVQVVSLNLLDENLPFTLGISLDALADASAERLRANFAEPGRQWAGYIVGCLWALYGAGHLDLRDPAMRGVNLAVYSTVTAGAGISSSAALEVATMMNLVDHFDLRDASREKPIGPMDLALLCQKVENQIVGAPCGIMDQAAACLGEPGELLAMLCQPAELRPSLALPARVRVVGMDTGVKHAVGGSAYQRTRTAAFMGHRIILRLMQNLGEAAGRTLVADPMHGYLANLAGEDYKRLFRPHLPETLSGAEYLDRYGPTVDPASLIDPAQQYPIQHAVDHHVLEAGRVRRFATLIEQALGATGERRGSPLDRAGHLMYASHQSYTMDAMLGAPEADMIVSLVRAYERSGLYGARITGGGSGGTVAILCNQSESADRAIDMIKTAYESQFQRSARLYTGSSRGAWHVGTTLVKV